MQCRLIPVEGSVVQQNLDGYVLFQKTEGQNGHGGEADVVHRQIGRVVQGLGKSGEGRNGAPGAGLISR